MKITPTKKAFFVPVNDSGLLTKTRRFDVSMSYKHETSMTYVSYNYVSLLLLESSLIAVLSSKIFIFNLHILGNLFAF